MKKVDGITEIRSLKEEVIWRISMDSTRILKDPVRKMFILTANIGVGKSKLVFLCLLSNTFPKL